MVASLIGRGASKIARKVVESGAKKGRGTKQERGAAKRLGISVPELRKRRAAKADKVAKDKAAKKVTTIPTSESKIQEEVKKWGKGRSKKERNELKKLMKDQAKAEKARAGSSAEGIRRQKHTPEGKRLFDNKEYDKILANPKKYMYEGHDASLVPKGKLTAKERKNLELHEQVEEARGAAPPEYTRKQAAEKMGLRGKGKISEEEIREAGGFQIRKHGGIVKRNMGGPVHGVGKALKGFGNAKYSRKMY